MLLRKECSHYRGQAKSCQAEHALIACAGRNRFLATRLPYCLLGMRRRIEQEIAGRELAAPLPRLFRTRRCRVKEIARDLEAQTPVALPLRLVEILVGGGLLGKGRIPQWYCVMSAGSSPVRVGLTYTRCDTRSGSSSYTILARAAWASESRSRSTTSSSRPGPPASPRARALLCAEGAAEWQDERPFGDSRGVANTCQAERWSENALKYWTAAVA